MNIGLLALRKILVVPMHSLSVLLSVSVTIILFRLIIVSLLVKLNRIVSFEYVSICFGFIICDYNLFCFNQELVKKFVDANSLHNLN